MLTFATKDSRKIRFAVLSMVLFVGITLLVYFFVALRAPADFPVPGEFTIKSGTPVAVIARDLKKEHFIKSPFLMKFLLKISKRDDQISAGTYHFDQKTNLRPLLDKMTDINYHGEEVIVTIPEGTDVKGIANIISQQVEDFDREKFIKLADDKEGYLFPDTYHFAPTITPEKAIEKMEKNFSRRLEPLQEKIKSSKYSLLEIITLASILEEEGNNKVSRKMVMGILENRLKINMPLQVDATFLKINGKNTYELSTDDLHKNKSPYNTYVHKGLPPGPISNPGLESIKAVLDPTPSDYLFYLTDTNGEFYYAKTFAGHRRNRARHMK